MTYNFFYFMEAWQLRLVMLGVCLVAAALMHEICYWLKRHTQYKWVRLLVRRDILEKWEQEATK